MSGETGQLQRLTDEQVNARLAAYNAQRLARPRRRADSRQVPPTSSIAEVRAQFGPERGERSRRIYAGKVDAALGPDRRRIRPPNLREQTSVPQYIAARTQIANRVVAGIVRALPDDPDSSSELHLRLLPADLVRDRHHPRPGRAARGDPGRRHARPRERAVRAPRRRSRARQHRAIEVADRAHPLDCGVGARNARQDERSRRRRRAVRGRDARSRPDRRRPHPRDRGRPLRSRSRRGRRDPRRRPGEPGGEGQPGAVRPRRSDRIDPQPDPRHRGPDQPPRAQRHHRGGARGRRRPRLRGRRAGSEEPRLADRARDRRHHREDHRDPAGDAPDGRRQRLDPGHGRGSAELGRPDPRGDGAPGADGDDDHRGGRRDRARRRTR